MNNEINKKEFSSGSLLKDEISRNTMMYFVFTALVALFIFAVINNEQDNSIVQLWLASIEINTAVLALFHYLSNFKRIDPFSNRFFTFGFIFNGLIWGALGSIVLSRTPTESHVLIIMSLVAVVAFGVPLFTASYRLVLLFSSLVLLPPAFYFLSEMTAVSIGKGLVIATLIPVVLRAVKMSRDFQTRSDSLRIKHQRLIDQLNEAVEETKTANVDLINEINEKKLTEKALIKARDEAEAAVEAKSEFLASMSHEIRTPMNGVLGMTELLIATELNSKQQRFAETIHKSGSALLLIINDILDFSKIEAGKLELNKTVFDLRLLMEDLGVMFANQAHQKGLELTCHYPADGHSFFRGDAERIRQILINLIGNALKFTEKGEILLKIELFEKKNDAYLVRFRVRDSGIGISEEAQNKIFNSFSQADGSTTRKFGGTGLGLTISKKLTELMDGKIGLKSQPDLGSTFWFSIPLKKEVAVKPSLSGKASLDFKNTRVLIADGNKANSEVLEQQFTSWGMDYYSIDNGKKALGSIRDASEQGNPFSLIILDNQLPGLDGITLAKKINNDPDISDTKIIMLSSVGNMEETGQWLMAGIDSYLSKPVRQNELYESVYKALISDEDKNNNDIEQKKKIPQEEKTFDLNGHILVAEDNFVNQELAREMITILGCTVEIVDNGRQAFDAIAGDHLLDNLHQPYDLILMDCQMPEMDGFEATEKLRQWEGQQKVLQRIPIIALTANAMEGDRDKCIAAGMDDYMTKPFTLDQLGALLHRWLPLLAKENKSEYVQKNSAQENDTPAKSKDLIQLDIAALDKIRKLQRNGQPNVVVKVIKLFLENSQKTILSLESAISKGDSTTLQRTAYSLKSSCATVGARDLARLCSELESLGKLGNAGEAQSRLSVLEYEYDAVCAALQNVIEEEMEAA